MTTTKTPHDQHAIIQGRYSETTNRDGVVTLAEFMAYRARTTDALAGDPFAHVGSHWFERADAKGDRRVTLSEAEVRPTQLFHTADLNHDGVISAQERKLAMALLVLHTTYW